MTGWNWASTIDVVAVINTYGVFIPAPEPCLEETDSNWAPAFFNANWWPTFDSEYSRFVDGCLSDVGFDSSQGTSGGIEQGFNGATDYAWAGLSDPKSDSEIERGAWFYRLLDSDSDDVPDNTDNCPDDANAEQINTDGANDGGDACDNDDDNDMICDIGAAVTEICIARPDNCPTTPNNSQSDSNEDGIGDACDADNDGVPGDIDNCPLIANTDQSDSDGNGRGDVCEGLPPGC